MTITFSASLARYVVLAALLLVATAGVAGAETLPIARVGGGYSPDHGGAELTAGVGGVLVGERVAGVGDLAFDYRGADGKLLSFGAGLAVRLEEASFIFMPRVLVGSIHDERALGVRGSLFIVGAGLLYAEVGYDYLWLDQRSERGGARFAAGINVAFFSWIPDFR